MIEAKGMRLVISSKEMVPREPYMFNFLGVQIVAIRNDDDTVSVYQTVEESGSGTASR